jgi:hypothetical protein
MFEDRQESSKWQQAAITSLSWQLWQPFGPSRDPLERYVPGESDSVWVGSRLVTTTQRRYAAIAVLATSFAVGATGVATAAPTTHRLHVSGIARGAPRAAVQAEPALPRPSHKQWPFPDRFPRTDGTGRLARGASLWTDFLFDDHGATAPSSAPVSPAATQSSLAPTQGVAAYPAGPAKNNGADIFRAAVGETRKATYWRVDWTTLVKPTVPIAEWAFDTDNSAKTGASAWPAGAGVTSPGIDRALVVSAQGAEVVNPVTGKSHPVGRLVINRPARSFIVRVPRRALRVNGKWRIRLASGLASPDGKSFVEPDYSQSLDLTSAQADQLPHVFNVTFRKRRQEPPVFRNGQSDAQIQQFAASSSGNPVNHALGLNGLSRFITGNFWMEDHQADALENGGDVSKFSRVIRWSRLRHHATTPMPQPRGYSNRWYVSRLHLGQGVVGNPSNAPEGDLRPNYRTRVQPYAVYVPRHLSLRRKRPLTWILHSLGVNLNQYGALDPHQIQQECQHRHSICATTEGLGPDGWYFDKSEQDFWAVWHALASSYRLDPRRTVISGYSMGGWASYKLGLAHPDLFSQAMPLEGPPDCGIRFLALNGQEIKSSAGSGKTGHCGADGNTNQFLGNALWLPYDVTQGGIDELVPAPSNVQATDTLQQLGERYTFFFLPADDHLAYATQDRFGGVVRALGKHVPRVKRNPGLVRYAWYPDLDNRHLGIGATTAYWVTHLTASTHKPGAIASVKARSRGIRTPRITPVVKGPTSVTTPLPAERTTLRWKRGPKSARHDRLRLVLSSVKALRVNAARARLSCPRVIATADRPVRLRLTHLHGGAVTIRLPAGHSTHHVRCPHRH